MSKNNTQYSGCSLGYYQGVDYSANQLESYQLALFMYFFLKSVHFLHFLLFGIYLIKFTLKLSLVKDRSFAST